MLRPRLLTACGAFALATAAFAQPGSGPLFPEPFRVTHHLIQDDGDGSRFIGEPVVDTYGGSWIVSERPDGSRLIVDLVRRELTEVRPEKGTFWTVSFDRFAELQKRLQAAQVTHISEAAKVAAPSAKPAELVVSDVPLQAHAASTAGVVDMPGVRHLRVTAKGNDEPALDVWVDPSVRLTPAAVDAVSRLEAVLAGPSADKAPGRFVAAARAHASGALPVRTVRPLARVGSVEDAATDVERLERFPSELAEIPEGLKRVPHPLEAAVRFLEEDAARNAVMSGLQGEGTQQP
jgi:hypothetical protein